MRVVLYLLWLMLLTLLQPTLMPQLAVWGIAPNLFLCFVVVIGYYRGVLEGGICGMVFGLVYDLLIGRMIGVNAMLYLYLGVGAGLLGSRFFGGGKKLAITLSAGAGTLLTAIVYYLARKAVYGDISFVTAVFRIGFLEAVYHMLAAFLLSFAVAKSMKWLRVKQIS